MEWKTAHLLKEKNYGRLMLPEYVGKKRNQNMDFVGKKRVMYKSYPLYLPDDETLKKFIEAYPNTRNEDLKAITGHGISYNSRLGNYLGLKKTEEFRKAMQLNASRAGTTPAKNKEKSMKMKGTQSEHLKLYAFGAPLGFKPTPEQRAEIDRKKGAALKETYKAEKRRAMFGLPQKTNVRLASMSRQKVCFRSRLKRKLFYIEVEHNVFTFDENTKRSEYMERTGREKYNIRFIER